MARQHRLISEPHICECNDHAFVTLTKGYVTLVNPEDADILIMPWWASVRRNTVYAMRSIKNDDGTWSNVRLHRQLLQLSGNTEGDHIDGNGLNNKRKNLRPATHSQNQRNRKSARGASSRFLGVSWDQESRRWKASIQFDKRLLCIGRFSSEMVAAQAYESFAKTHHGQFARLNISKID